MKSYTPVNNIIVAAMAEVFPDIPCGHLRYTGKSQNYAIFRVSSRIKKGIGSGNNRRVDSYGFIDIYTRYDLTVSGSELEMVDEIFSENGIWVRGINSLDYQEEVNLFHVEIEFIIPVDESVGGKANVKLSRPSDF